MRLSTIGIAVAVAASLFGPARADLFTFDTESTAVQTIALGVNPGVAVHATGTQHFTIDTTAGTAEVTSFFQGTDLPDPEIPGGLVSFNLFNTTTTGTVTQNLSGTFNVTFNLLFEVDITSGEYNGMKLVTTSTATFANLDVAGFPFAPGTAFSDPGAGPDTVAVFVSFDPTGHYAPGTLAGTSSDRVVTIVRAVPEPASAMLLGAGGIGLIGYGRLRRSRRR